MNKQQYTKREHFVPVVYQKGFSFDGKHVYVNSLIDNGIRNVKRKMEEVCVKNDAYENKDILGNYVERNYTESALCEIEGSFGPVRDEIVKRIDYNQQQQRQFFDRT